MLFGIMSAQSQQAQKPPTDAELDALQCQYTTASAQITIEKQNRKIAALQAEVDALKKENATAK